MFQIYNRELVEGALKESKKKINFFKCIVFIVGALIILQGALYILKRPKNEQWDASGLKYAHDNPDFYDVIFCGTSIAVMNVSSEELYSKYGIASVTLGEPEQPVYLSYYTLKDALEDQSPQVVFYDINALFYSIEMLKNRLDSDEYYYLHLSVDGIKDYKTKYEAVQVAKTLKPSIDIISYFSSLYNNHSNWENVNKPNFIRKSGKMVMNGNLMSFDIADGLTDLRNSINTSYDSTVSANRMVEFNKKYLLKIIELCKEKSVDLVLLRGAGVNTYLSNADYNMVDAIAKEYNLPFIDISQCEDEVGIDWNVDSTDGNHHNIVGAKKWTDYLGEYLISNYQITDKRDNLEYDYFENEKQRYEEALEIMETKIALLSATSFGNYLNELKKIDTNDNAIFISISDDATESLLDEEIKQMSELGIESDLKDKFRYSFAAVIDNNHVEEMMKKGKVSLEGTLENDINYSIVSGGYLSGTAASISLNGQNVIQGGRGFNIVVYNKKYGEILSNVYFDTFANVNPQASRRSELVQTQYETGVNQWRAIE